MRHSASLINLLASKWTIPVICVLQQNTLRYNVIEKATPSISQRALTITLRSLERNGMIERRVYPTIPPQVEYALTPLGLEVLKLCEILSDWEEKHRTEIKRAQKAYARRYKDVATLL